MISVVEWQWMQRQDSARPASPGFPVPITTALGYPVSVEESTLLPCP